MRHEASQGEEGNEKGQTQEKEIKGKISRGKKKYLFFS
jgi:hypothetical protein